MTTAYNKFFINGEWVEPDRPTLEVINPANEEPFATISMGTAADVDGAAKAAKAAFASWSASSIETRKNVLGNIIAGLKGRSEEMAVAISTEMGAPMGLSKTAQVGSGMGHFMTALKILEDFEFEEMRGSTRIVKESAGVCGFITPLELAAEPDCLQSGASDRRWLHHGS